MYKDRSAIRKILFIIPKRTFRQEYLSYTDKNPALKKDIVSNAISNPVAPYGILSIATYIKEYARYNLDIKIVDFNVIDYRFSQLEKITIDILKRFHPDIIGISALFTPTYDSIDYFCSIAKKINAETITIAGGACATNEYKDLLEDSSSLDAICYSEGEIPFLELVNADNFHDVMKNHISFITRQSIKQCRKPKPSFINNLDEIPFLDFGLVNLDSYKQAINNNTYIYSSQPEKSVYLPIHTTRGCPFRCVFCAAASVHGKKVRQMSAEYVLENVKNMVDKYGLTHLTIEDDQFLLKQKRAKKILRGMLKLADKVHLSTLLVTPSYIDDEIVDLFKKLGVNEIPLTIEHGSQYVLKEIIDKPFSVEDIRTAVKIIKNHGLSVMGALVIGLPGERDKDREDTIALIKELGIDWTIISIATPFKGSRLYEICTENDYLITKDIRDADLKHAIIQTKELNPEYITKQAYMMNLELNFVNNYSMRVGDFEKAILLLGNIVKRYPQQAFAHYYLSEAHKAYDHKTELIDMHMNKYLEIIASNDEWMEFAKNFGLPTDRGTSYT